MRNTLTERQNIAHQQIVEAIIYLYTEARRATKEVARSYGLTGPQVSVIKILHAVGDLSLSQLSAQMSARNSTITGIVDRMEQGGWVLRARSTRDRRVVRIDLTEQGRRLAAEVPVPSMVLLEGALASLSDADQASLQRILSSLAKYVREESLNSNHTNTSE